MSWADISSDGKQVVSCSWDNQVLIFDRFSGNQIGCIKKAHKEEAKNIELKTNLKQNINK